MSNTSSETSGIMAALEQFEAAEANLIKLERLWEELAAMIPSGVAFGENVEHEDRVRSYNLLLGSLPRIDGWKPVTAPMDFDAIGQNRFDAMELGEPSVHMSVERAIEEPGRELREYRFRFNNTRKALIRDALIGLIDQVDADIRAIRAVASADPETGLRLNAETWTPMREHMKQIEVLLGSTVKKPVRWTDMMRHIHFGYVGDLDDIERMTGRMSNRRCARDYTASTRRSRFQPRIWRFSSRPDPKARSRRRWTGRT
jgi:hypothetical protein